MGIVRRLTVKLLKQTERPSGLFGRFFARTMNISHSRLTDWGLTHISIGRHDTILDVGCGGGRTVRKLAAIAAEGRVCGIDYSEESVSVARSKNEQLINAGRVEIRHGSVSHLPFPDCTFDLVTAVETHYFWPDLVADIREVQRVLKPGGRLMILAEVYKGGRHYGLNRRFIEPASGEVRMAFPGVDEFMELFSAACYSDARVFEEPDKGWLCCVGLRPS